MTHKNIEAFVRHSIKTGADPDYVELQALLNKMNTAELQHFWMRYAASLSLSRATTAVPYWETKQERAHFMNALGDLLFYPNEKDASGKYVIVREELEAHIKTKLTSYIQAERQLRNAYKNRPVLDKIHSAIGLSVLIMILPFLICSILSLNRILPTLADAGILLFILLFATYLFFPIVRWLIRRLGLREDDA